MKRFLQCNASIIVTCDVKCSHMFALMTEIKLHQQQRKWMH